MTKKKNKSGFIHYYDKTIAAFFNKRLTQKTVSDPSLSAEPFFEVPITALSVIFQFDFVYS